jgi:hypothetical protein
MPTTPLPLDRPAVPLDLAPGGEVVLRGSFESGLDGSIIDARTTTWPKGVPGGESVDPGGLVDLAGGGLHVREYDAAAHVVKLVAEDGPAPACAAVGVAAPCLPMRTLALAQSRLKTVAELRASLHGGIQIETTAPPPLAPVANAAAAAAPWLGGLGVIAVAIGAVLLVGSARRRRAASPAGRLAALASGVRAKLEAAPDPVLAAALRPALDAAAKALREGRVDATSAEGARVAEALRRVDARLDDAVTQKRAAEEREAADELVRDVEGALEAADEAHGATARRL